jgi:hypothetical protein
MAHSQPEPKTASMALKSFFVFGLSPLFAPSGFAQFVRQLFVNLSPVAEREYPYEPGFAIDFIDEAKPSHLVFPQAG